MAERSSDAPATAPLQLPSTNETTSPGRSTWDSVIDLNVMLTIVYLAIFFIGVIGNICNCLVIADPRNRYMKTATNYYLFSLSISDLLLLIFGLPHDLVILWHPTPYLFGEFVCISRGWISEASTYASVLVIVAFTVERYLAICHPLKAHTLSRLSRSIKIIVLIWLVASTCALIVVMQYGLVLASERLPDGSEAIVGPQCTTVRRSERIFELSVLIFFIIPMAVITILYVKLGYILRQKTRLIKKSRDQKRERLCDLAQAAANENAANKATRQHLLLAPPPSLAASGATPLTRSELQLCRATQESSVVTCPVVLASADCWGSQVVVNHRQAKVIMGGAGDRANKKRLSISCDPITPTDARQLVGRWRVQSRKDGLLKQVVVSNGTRRERAEQALEMNDADSRSLSSSSVAAQSGDILAKLGHSQGPASPRNQEAGEEGSVATTTAAASEQGDKSGAPTCVKNGQPQAKVRANGSSLEEGPARKSARKSLDDRASCDGGETPSGQSPRAHLTHASQPSSGSSSNSSSNLNLEATRDKVSRGPKLKLSGSAQQVGGLEHQHPGCISARLSAPKRKEGSGTGAGPPTSNCSNNSQLKQYPFALHSTVNTANMHSVIKMLVSVVVMFFICWAPFHAQRLMAIYVNEPTSEQEFIFSLLNHISGVSYYISAVVNPILYSLFSVKFRQAFRNTFGSLRPNSKGANRQHRTNSYQANQHPNTTEVHTIG